MKIEHVAIWVKDLDILYNLFWWESKFEISK